MTLPAFSSWAGPHSAACVFIGEAWGRDEESTLGPFVGAAGKELWKMLGEANPDLAPELHEAALGLHQFGNSWINARRPWMEEANIAFTNVVNVRPDENKFANLCVKKDSLPPGYTLPPVEHGLYLDPRYLPELDRLCLELTAFPRTLLVPMGSKACWALLGQTNIFQIRGSVTMSAAKFGPIKTLPTWHPAGLLYEGQWSRRPVCVADLMKAGREMRFEGIRRPRREIIISPTIEEWEDWIETALSSPPPLLACDTETSLGMIDTISFASSRSSAISVQFRPHRVKVGTSFRTIYPIRDGQKVANYWTLEEERRFWTSTREILESPIPKLGQNFMYDLQYLHRSGIRPRAVREDSMLLHHSLFPEMPKGLGFLGSIYSDEASWKLMNSSKRDSEKRDE